MVVSRGRHVQRQQPPLADHFAFIFDLVLLLYHAWTERAARRPSTMDLFITSFPVDSAQQQSSNEFHIYTGPPKSPPRQLRSPSPSSGIPLAAPDEDLIDLASLATEALTGASEHDADVLHDTVAPEPAAAGTVAVIIPPRSADELFAPGQPARPSPTPSPAQDRLDAQDTEADPDDCGAADDADIPADGQPPQLGETGDSSQDPSRTQEGPEDSDDDDVVILRIRPLGQQSQTQPGPSPVPAASDSAKVRGTHGRQPMPKGIARRVPRESPSVGTPSRLTKPTPKSKAKPRPRQGRRAAALDRVAKRSSTGAAAQRPIRRHAEMPGKYCDPCVHCYVLVAKADGRQWWRTTSSNQSASNGRAKTAVQIFWLSGSPLGSPRKTSICRISRTSNVAEPREG